MATKETKDIKETKTAAAVKAAKEPKAAAAAKEPKATAPAKASKAPAAAKEPKAAAATAKEPKATAAAKESKAAAAVKEPKAPAAAKESKAAAATKATKPAEAAEATKVTEVTEVTKAVKATKATKPAEAAEATEDIKGIKQAKAIALKVVNNKGEKVGTQKLDEAIFGIAPNIHIMHEVCRAQMAASRAGTHDTKTRGQVTGGGRKPFRQKGTGRARQGSSRAPQNRGGGVVFGPHPRSYAFKVNGKEVKLAMRSALSAKQAEGVLFVVDSFSFEKPSTKEAVKYLEALDIKGRVTLVITNDEVNAFLSFRNLPQVRVLDVTDANTYDFIDNKALVFSQTALQRIEEVLR